MAQNKEHGTHTHPEQDPSFLGRSEYEIIGYVPRLHEPLGAHGDGIFEEKPSPDALFAKWLVEQNRLTEWPSLVEDNQPLSTSVHPGIDGETT